MRVAVVVPVHRNAATLEALHARLAAAIAPVADAIEFVFVDDACPEGSLAVLRRIAATDPRVAVVALAENVGQNRAVLMGLARADADAVVVLDADLQDPPEAVPLLLAELRGDVDAVFGGRRGEYQSGARMATSRMWKLLLHVLTARRLPADAGLFVAMTRRMAQRIAAAADGDAYVLALMARTGLRMTSVPVRRDARPVGTSSYDSARRARTAWLGVRTAVRGRGART
jgi:glycosyltransferase involved in cell wall biosynthesis